MVINSGMSVTEVEPNSYSKVPIHDFPHYIVSSEIPSHIDIIGIFLPLRNTVTIQKLSFVISVYM